MAKGIKDEPYSKDSQEIDLQAFRAKLEECLVQIEEPRVEDNQKFEFSTLIGIILCAVVAGANGISDIHHYAEAKQNWLSTWLDFSNGVPSYMAFWWLLVRLKPEQTEKLFRRWLTVLAPEDLKGIIAIDGKRVKGASHGKTSKSLLHMVSAWSSVRGLILGQVKTEEKSNEITAIPELLNTLNISGAVITSDAMGCQKEIASQIVEKGGDYAIALKGNQQSLHDEVENFFEQAKAMDFDGIQCSRCDSREVGHGRTEERTVYVSNDIDWLPMKEEWAELQSIVMVISKRTIDEKTTKESRFYITTLEPDAERLGRVIRAHWGIENKVHWVLDVTFKEDASQVSTGYAAQNLSILRRLTLNMLRLDPDTKTSLKAKRKRAGWNNDYLSHLLRFAINNF